MWLRFVFLAVFAWQLGPASSQAEEERVAVSIRYLQIKGISHYGLYLYQSDGKLIRVLTHPSYAQDTRPVFSANGKSVYFTRTRGKKTDFMAIGINGKHLRVLDTAEAAAYTATPESPSYQYADDATEKTPAPGEPVHYPAPDDSQELLFEAFDPNEPEGTDEDYYSVKARHVFLVNLRTGEKTALASLPGCTGVGTPLQLSDPGHAVYLIEPPLRSVFLWRHLNSTDGTTVFALDLERRQMVRLGPNWSTVFPLPGAPAFYTVTYERYRPLGDRRTVNCGYLERWNAAFEKVRFAEPKVAVFGGASIYRKNKPALNILSVGAY